MRLSAEFVREIAEVLRENGHRGSVEDVLEPRSQAQREHVAKTGRIHGAYRGVGRHEGEVGGEVVDRVDASTQIVEFRFAQAESRRANVPGHDPDARPECVVPDLGVLQGGAYPREAMLDAVRANQAMHHEAVVLPQEIAQQKAAHEPGGARQQHLPESRSLIPARSAIPPRWWNERNCAGCRGRAGTASACDLRGGAPRGKRGEFRASRVSLATGDAEPEPARSPRTATAGPRIGNRAPRECPGL